MEQVIALEWGRFSREAELVPAETPGRKGSAASGTRQETEENSKETFLLGLENALALPAEPGMELYEENIALPAAHAIRLATQQLAGDSVIDEQHPRLPEASPDAADAGQGSQHAAAIESGTYQNRFMWTGTSFEERMVLIVPPQPEIAVLEPKPAIALDETPAETKLPVITLEPLTEKPSEAAAGALEMQSSATVEEMPVQEPPSPMTYDNIPPDAWQPALHADAAALAPSNGSKLLQEAHGSDRSRWFVLNGMLNGAPAPDQPPVDAPAGSIPVLEVFSLAGGVGKTSLVAALGRALSARGERVLLVEATTFGSLPCFFGACDCRPGVLRTFRPPASSSNAPIRLATVNPESLQAESAEQGSLATEIQGWAQGTSRVIVDVATGSVAAARSLSQMSPIVLVPLVPDVRSVITANSIDSFFHQRENAQGVEAKVYYVLNQFDRSLPLHLEVGKALHAVLGERLLPFALERSPDVSEALADGMTVVDYAPGSALVEDYIGLAEWVQQVMAPAQANPRGARWSEQ